METKAKIQMMLACAVCVSILAFSLGCATTEPPTVKATPGQEISDEPDISIMAVTAEEEPAKMQVTEVAFPTGNKETSAILLRRRMPAEVVLEAEYTYEYHVTNLTDLTHQNVKITIEGTRNLEVLSSSPVVTEGVDGSLRWLIGDLAPHETKVIRVRATSESVGTASDCISVTYANALCGQTKVVSPDLLLELVDDGDPAEIGKMVTYTVTVRNRGSATGTNIAIVCEIPFEQEYVSAEGPTPGTLRGQTLEFAPLPRLDVGAMKQWKIQVRTRRAGDVLFGVSMTTDQLRTKVRETEATTIY